MAVCIRETLLGGRREELSCFPSTFSSRCCYTAVGREASSTTCIDRTVTQMAYSGVDWRCAYPPRRPQWTPATRQPSILPDLCDWTSRRMPHRDQLAGCTSVVGAADSSRSCICTEGNTIRLSVSYGSMRLEYGISRP